MSQPDEQFVRSCLEGNPGAFRQLVERHQVPLRRYLCARLGNPKEATEAAQETSVAGVLRARRIAVPGAFFTWLIGIADRVTKEAYRAAKKRRIVDCEQIEIAARSETHDTRSDAMVMKAVAGSCPDVYREVVLLRFFRGQSCVEISRDLDVPLGTVSKRLSRAYALLREHLTARASTRRSEASR